MTKVGDLQGKLQRGVYQISPDTAEKLGMPEQILVDKVVSTYTIEKSSIIFFDVAQGFTKNHKLVPADLELIAVPPKTAEKIERAFSQHAIKDLNSTLSMAMTIGADPEGFIENDEGELIYAFNILPDKEHALKTPGECSYPGLTVYNDGFAFEYNTKAGLTCLQQMTDSIHNCLGVVYKEAKKHGGKISSKTCFEIPLETLDKLPREQTALGCHKSYNAYGLIANLELEGHEIPIRSAGGHIHFGVNYGGKELPDEQYIKMVKSLDMILGVSCVSLFAEFDDPMRRQFYGLPGEFRKPAHGLEYRTLSNAYYCHPCSVNLVIDFARKVCAYGTKGLRQYWQSTEEETIEVIASCDVKKAREIMERNKSTLVGLFKAAYRNSQDAGEMGYKVFYEGLHSLVNDPTDVAGNWSLDGGKWRESKVTEWANGSRCGFQAVKDGKKV